MEYRDEAGRVLTAAEFQERVGAVQVHARPRPDAPGWAVSLLQIHRDSEAELRVWLRQDGYPVSGRKVAWAWPDAPIDEGAGWLGRCDPANTNTDGIGSVGLSMGPGAYYFPPAGGPHAVWVYGAGENGEMVDGLGMLGGSEHDHVDAFFDWQEPGEAGQWEQLARDVADIKAMVRAIFRLLTRDWPGPVPRER